jgi:hypothetical protein
LSTNPQCFTIRLGYNVLYPSLFGRMLIFHCSTGGRGGVIRRVTITSRFPPPLATFHSSSVSRFCVYSSCCRLLKNSRYNTEFVIFYVQYFFTSRHTILIEWNTVLLKNLTVRSASHESTRLLWNWKSHNTFMTAHQRSKL